jgi:hypothetical protein
MSTDESPSTGYSGPVSAQVRESMRTTESYLREGRAASW